MANELLINRFNPLGFRRPDLERVLILVRHATACSGLSCLGERGCHRPRQSEKQRRRVPTSVDPSVVSSSAGTSPCVRSSSSSAVPDGSLRRPRPRRRPGRGAGRVVRRSPAPAPLQIRPLRHPRRPRPLHHPAQADPAPAHAEQMGEISCVSRRAGMEWIRVGGRDGLT